MAGYEPELENVRFANKVFRDQPIPSIEHTSDPYVVFTQNDLRFVIGNQAFDETSIDQTRVANKNDHPELYDPRIRDPDRGNLSLTKYADGQYVLINVEGEILGRPIRFDDLSEKEKTLVRL